MKDAKGGKKRFEFLKLAPTIRINGNDYCFELVFHKNLEGGKNSEHIIFVFNRIEPNIVSEMIHKNNKVFILINEVNRR